MSEYIDRDRAVTNKIKEVLKRDDTILFIGSGISLWSGMPSWNGLIKELVDFLNNEGYSPEPVCNELKGNNLLRAASLGVNQLTPQVFRKFIRGALKIEQVKPHLIHNKICNIGAKCYITTNYDHLLEDSLRKCCPDFNFQVITNKQKIDCATIMQVREKNFIFKPHGDIDDTESIILTNEHYRTLYGQKSYTLETLKTLFLSRTVVFLGFGLNDPDFLYIKDTIENTFENGQFIHYAIMPEMSYEQKEYWLKYFGIQILSYKTSILNDGSIDHSELINLIDSFNNKEIHENVLNEENIENELIDSKQILLILRYLSTLNFKFSTLGNIELPLNVEKIKHSKNIIISEIRIEQLLHENCANVVLLGNPGAGKTYSLKKYCNKLAYQVKELLIKGDSYFSDVKIPIYIDLKHYSGSIRKMVEQQLLVGISLDLLIKQEKLIFIFDSFNEMPKEYFENKLYEQDFLEFSNDIGSCRIIFGSRTSEGLEKFNYEIYKLEEISMEFIEEYINKNNIIIYSAFKYEVLNLIRKPLFFRLLCDGKIRIESNSTPIKIYQSLFEYLKDEFFICYGYSLDFIDILKNISFEAIDSGRETFSYMELQATLKRWLNNKSILCNERDIINWLIEAQQFLIPAPNMKLSFFHQSITEFLAAVELANRYKDSSYLLSRYLKFTRWDQTLFLTTSFLNGEESDNYIEEILNLDILLALKASKYIEYNSEKVICKILQYIIDNFNDNTLNFEREFEIAFELNNLPVTKKHINQLEVLLEKHNIWGGEAAKLIDKILGIEMKDKFISEMLENIDDFNYLTSLGEITAKYMLEEDYSLLISKLEEIDCYDLDSISSGFGKLLSNISLESILKLFSPYENLNKVQLAILCEILSNSSSELSVKACIDLIKLKIKEAVFSLYLLLNYEKIIIEHKLFDDNFISSLNYLLYDKEIGYWVVNLLNVICDNFPKFKAELNKKLEHCSQIEEIAYLYCLRTDYLELFWIKYFDFIKQCNNENNYIIKGFSQLVIDDKINEIFTMILEKREVNLLFVFLESVRDIKGNFFIDFEIIHELLEWMNINKNEFSECHDGFIYNILGEFIVSHISDGTISNIITLFNKQDCIERYFLSEYILCRINELKIDKLSEEAVSYLINALNKGINNGRLICNVATEKFVDERLIPLLMKEEEPLKSNLRNLLNSLGKRHKRRYLIF